MTDIQTEPRHRGDVIESAICSAESLCSDRIFATPRLAGTDLARQQIEALSASRQEMLASHLRTFISHLELRDAPGTPPRFIVQPLGPIHLVAEVRADPMTLYLFGIFA